MATTRSLSLWRRRSTSLLFARNIWSLCKNGPSPLPNSCYDFPHNKVLGPLNTSKKFWLDYYHHIHTSTPDENFVEKPSENNEIETSMDENENSKPKRKKLKGKRAVIKWLKHFRRKKKKEFERMTSEEKILYKLKLARGREERFINALKKIEPNFSKEAKHDPEILTPEVHFYFLKMGLKCKNYVPIGRRGIFQGVILNMHLHWKKHQTLKVIVKTFTKEEVKDIAAELARLSGGIVLDIVEDENEIIMYRGKNYVQSPTEIMSPKVTLSRKKAMDKSKYLEKLRMVRRDIPRLEQELESLHMRMNTEREIQIKPDSRTEIQETKSLEQYEIQETESNCLEEEQDFDSGSENSTFSEEENLSDIFETDSEEGQGKEEMEGPVFLDVLERFNYEKEEEIQESFEEHLCKIGDVVKRDDLCRKEINVSELDEIDRIFLSASSILKFETDRIRTSGPALNFGPIGPVHRTSLFS